jgi:hypothetical protein
MTTQNQNETGQHYDNYDQIVNHILKSIAIVRTSGKFERVMLDPKKIKHLIPELDLRIMRVDSLPTGAMALESMVIEFRSYKKPFSGSMSCFSVKYNQLTRTIGFKTSKEYDRDFDHCVFVYQSNDMNEIKSHIDKVMYNFIIKEKLFISTGESVEYEDLTHRHLTLLSMVNI